MDAHRSFNEAAAYNCGKRVPVGRLRAAFDAASMRPQHITAENDEGEDNEGSAAGCFNEAAAYNGGKLRELVAPDRHAEASMRPQHITAENRQPVSVASSIARASMRPQHITAENSFVSRSVRT